MVVGTWKHDRNSRGHEYREIPIPENPLVPRLSIIVTYSSAQTIVESSYRSILVGPSDHGHPSTY